MADVGDQLAGLRKFGIPVVHATGAGAVPRPQ